MSLSKLYINFLSKHFVDMGDDGIGSHSCYTYLKPNSIRNVTIIITIYTVLYQNRMNLIINSLISDVL